MAEEIRVRRRKLPHWELSGSVYFITFTTTDEGNLSEPAKEIVFESIKFHAGNKYDLHACVVMQTHAHIILSHRAQARTPMLPVGTGDLNQSVDSRFRLAEIMHGIKSYSSHRINQTMQRKGKVWLAESYDRVVRDEKEYLEKLNYILNNPVKAGLVEKPEDYKWLYFEGEMNEQAGTPVLPEE